MLCVSTQGKMHLLPSLVHRDLLNSTYTIIKPRMEAVIEFDKTLFTPSPKLRERIGTTSSVGGSGGSSSCRSCIGGSSSCRSCRVGTTTLAVEHFLLCCVLCQQCANRVNRIESKAESSLIMAVRNYSYV